MKVLNPRVLCTISDGEHDTSAQHALYTRTATNFWKSLSNITCPPEVGHRAKYRNQLVIMPFILNTYILWRTGGYCMLKGLAIRLVTPFRDNVLTDCIFTNQVVEKQLYSYSMSGSDTLNCKSTDEKNGNKLVRERLSWNPNVRPVWASSAMKEAHKAGIPQVEISSGSQPSRSVK